VRLAAPFDLARDTLPPIDALPFRPPEWPAAPGVVEAAVFRALVAAREEVGATPEPAVPRRPVRAHGIVTDVHTNGCRAAEWTYDHGVRQGPAATWHPDGEPDSEGEWNAGLPHRAFFRWWPSGRRMVHGEFDEGRAVGEWTVHDTDGRLVYQGPWRHTLTPWLPRDYADSVQPPRRR
jgi:hypothetical protein